MPPASLIMLKASRGLTFSRLILYILFPLLGKADEWDFDDAYREELLYMHAFVNYDFDPDWQQRWEKKLMKDKGLRISYGSVTSNKLFQHEDVIINQNLGDGWWFRGNFKRYFGRYKDISEDVHFIEFQRYF